jgi:hypothetical protein
MGWFLYVAILLVFVGWIVWNIKYAGKDKS